MSQDHTAADRNLPTRREALVFRVKSSLLQARRGLLDLKSKDVQRFGKGEIDRQTPRLAYSNTKLWTETEPEERFLMAGKIQNLRTALRNLDGLKIPAGKTFSFWKHIGRTTGRKGYVLGRELREGCIIPNIGGGICQLSNALYDAALQAGFEIVERHAHTQVIAGSLAEKGRDATVFWNYVDLRFRSDRDFSIAARLDQDALVLEFFGERPAKTDLYQISRKVLHNDWPNSCATCGMNDCHRAVDNSKYADFGSTAFLVDEYSPEFNEYIKKNRTIKDALFIPLDGKRFKKPNYGWATDGFGSVKQSLIQTLVRSFTSRRLASQGRERQLNLLSMYEKLADSYAKRLGHEALHLVVHQNLLPYLWRAGHLGGRTFDVLMNALPMNEIQKRLDRAHFLHPLSKTLGDFRADENLLRAEAEALAAANKIVTPHSEIAKLFQDKSELLQWSREINSLPREQQGDVPVIAFPAATVGRKGCYELREAVRGLNVKIKLFGPLIEGSDFWHGFDTFRGTSFEDVDLVVLPAFVEHRPRRLLAAAALGIPVIASDACGVEGIENVESINAGDAVVLRDKIVERLELRDADIKAQSGENNFAQSN